MRGFADRSVRSMVCALALAAILTVPAGKASAGSTSVAPLPTPLQQSGIASVAGRIYVFGGWSSTPEFDSISSAVYAYDPATDEWTERAPLPTRRHWSSCAVVSGIVYVIGGETRGISNPGWSSPTGVVEAYDPSTDTWSTKAPMPTARWGATAQTVDGTIYVIGGSDAYADYGAVEAYDPVTDSWSTRAPMPTGRRTHASGVVSGRIYVAGGANGPNALASLESYDPATDSWSQNAPMPSERHHTSGVVVDGRFYVFGGFSQAGESLNTVISYDSATDSWGNEESFQQGRGVDDLAAVGSTVYIVGGSSPPNETIASVEAWRWSGGSPPHADAGQDTTVECTSPGGATVTLDGTGSWDPDHDALSFHWDSQGAITFDDPESATPRALFPIGSHLITLTVTDGNGGLDVSDVLVTVVDMVPPQVVCTTDRAALWPANHKMVSVAVYVVATDACSAPGTLTLQSCTLASNEPDDASGNGDGSTIGDCDGSDGFGSPVDATGSMIYVASHGRFEGSVLLRAERNGVGKGRAYTLSASVRDASGNVTSATCVVVVPHER